jgi:hypothetical protein
MSGADWLSRQHPSPPPELTDAMRTAVNESQDPSPSDLLDAAERLLDKVLRTDCETRASALDLLTVDALMTHALRLAYDDPKLREEFPAEAMNRIASARQP